MKRYSILLFVLLIFGTIKAQYTVLHNFNYSKDGASPYGALTFSGKALYGMTRYGGKHNFGIIFKIDTNGSNYKNLHDFDSITGSQPMYDSLIYSSGTLYGMASSGGKNDLGCIFSIDTSGNNYKDMLDFDGLNGGIPNGGLTLYNDTLYGMTSAGGKYSQGCIFCINVNGTNYKDLFDFNGSDGASPLGTLTLSDKVLYGMTYNGGANSYGVIFSISIDGTNYKDLFDFNNAEGTHPYGDLTVSGAKMYGMVYTTGSAGFIFSIDTNKHNYKILLNLNNFDAGSPTGSFVISKNILYGMSAGGLVVNGISHGVIFSIDTDGTNSKNLFYFNGDDGYNPEGTLTLLGNVLYGMTTYGGINGAGVIFKVDSNAIAGINNISTPMQRIIVYPNPSNGQFTLSSSNINMACKVEIYNVLGEKVFTEPLNQSNSNINLSGQPMGVYLYRVVTQTGELVATGKVVVQR